MGTHLRVEGIPGDMSQAPAKTEKWSLRGIHVEFNLLFAKVKLLFAKRPIPPELPPAQLKRVETTVKTEVARIEELSTPAPTARRRGPAKRKRAQTRRASTVAQQNTIIRYVPTPARAPPRDVVRQTVIDLAARARKRAVREGDVVAALAAAYIENEASKPPKEPEVQVRW